VGKLVSNHLYLHEKYLSEALLIIRQVNPAIGTKLLSTFAKKDTICPNFEFNCVRLDIKHGSVRLDEAPDFDTAREPHVGKWWFCQCDGFNRKGESRAIWHHKFLWVKDSYEGFDVCASMRWSQKYCSVLSSVPKSSDKSWKEQLESVGLKMS
jgi:hypothetical protein